jgi:hypothetical protein
MRLAPTMLDVVIPFNNPMRWQARIANFRRCEDAVVAAGVRLTTVEMAYGDRPFELSDRDGVRRVRLRGGDLIWQKENLGRLGFAAIPDWRFGMLLDGDLLFLTPDWPVEVLQTLQLHRAAQVSSDLIWLGPRGEYCGHGVAFMSRYTDSRRRARAGKFWQVGWTLDAHGYPGGAWAWRREAYEAMGGLLDFAILGSGDLHMATALLDMPDPVAEDRDYSDGYRAALKAWRATAQKATGADVGHVPGIVLHLWHGHLDDRGYSTRGQILIRNRYDPATDIVRDRLGVIHLAGNKPLLRDDIRAYFAERDEDATDLRRRPPSQRPEPSLPVSYPQPSRCAGIAPSGRQHHD